MPLTFTANARMREAVALINSSSVSAKKFGALLTRMIAHEAESSDSSRATAAASASAASAASRFSASERAQLKGLLGVESGGELDLVLSVCSYIFQKAAYEGSKPSSLVRALSAVGMDDERCSAFGVVWKAHAAGMTANLRERTLRGPRELKGVDWALRMEIGGSGFGQAKESRAVLSFKIGASGKAEAETESVAVELGHEGLLMLLQDLNRLQSQLDALAQ